jgi:hypothetical protein
MEPMPQALVRRAGLPLILLVAVIQGWSLYALHWAIEAHRWVPVSIRMAPQRSGLNDVVR